MTKKTSLKKGRSKLKSYFETGNMPTEEQVVQFIESKINQGDDQITAVDQQNGRVYLGIGTEEPKKPITIQANSAEQSLLSFKDPLGTKTWSLDQRTVNKPGLNITKEESDQSHLFIQKETGNIGIKSSEPVSKLHINGALSSRDTSQNDQGILHIGHKRQDPGTEIKFHKERNSLSFKSSDLSHDVLTIQGDKNIGILTNDPASTLHINGSLQLTNGASVKSFSNDRGLTSVSDDKVPTEKAIKHFLLNSRKHNGTWYSKINKRNSIRISTVSNNQDWSNMPNMNMTIRTTGSPFLVVFKASEVQTTGIRNVHAEFRMLLAGKKETYCHHEFHNRGWELRDVSLYRLFKLPAGTYTIYIQWSVRSPSAAPTTTYTDREKRTRRKKWKFGPFKVRWGRETYYVNVTKTRPEVRAYLTACWYGGNRSLTAIEL